MRLLILFIYTFLLAFVLFPLFPSLRLTFFAPFLIISFYRQHKINCLWLAILCGFVLDLFSTQTRIGFYALTYCLTVELLYSSKRHFFEDSLSTIPLMTFFFAILATLLQTVLLYIFGQGLILSWQWAKNDLFWMPLQDALFAGLAFSFPSLLLPSYRPRRKANLLLVKENQ
ncbi:rod shape-determining protein MreD [Candidatus Protochlamydia phocaeensis]|uniref:rod shape-determining protein MreD n=1 Tax=Candidatus Protochlamydia phocaeensis TaxID=1414722 RepID=UPI00083837AB|nr:rod shape-determining protein MreD [Candidatus Protochlamydia phocaeensis]